MHNKNTDNKKATASQNCATLEKSTDPANYANPLYIAHFPDGSTMSTMEEKVARKAVNDFNKKATVCQKTPEENPNMKTDTQTAAATRLRFAQLERRELNDVRQQRDIATARLALCKAQADKLAEALRDALKYADSATEHPENKAAFKRIITTALAAYESEVQR